MDELVISISCAVSYPAPPPPRSFFLPRYRNVLVIGIVGNLLEEVNGKHMISVDLSYSPMKEDSFERTVFPYMAILMRRFLLPRATLEILEKARISKLI